MTERTILNSPSWDMPSPMNMSPVPLIGSNDQIYTAFMSPKSELNFSMMNSQMKTPTPTSSGNGLREVPGLLSRVRVDQSAIPPSFMKVSKDPYFATNLGSVVSQNTDYRRVVHTGKIVQTVVMALKAGEVIDREIHDDTEQILLIQEGLGYAEIEDPITKQIHTVQLSPGSELVIQPMTYHKIVTTSNMKLISFYSPPEHPDGLVQPTKPGPANFNSGVL